MSKAGRIAAIAGVLVVAPAGLWALAQTGTLPSLLSAAPSISPSPTRSPSPALRGPFAAGACVSFAPLRGPARGVVFLDAGHGGLDPGAKGVTSDGRRIEEKSVTLAIVQETARQLREAGYRIVASRWTDTLVGVPARNEVNDGILTGLGVHRDLLARIRCANDARADVLLSVHMNAFSDPAEGGTMTFFDPDRPFSVANRRFADVLHARVVTALRSAGVDVQDRRVVPDTVSMGRKALTTQAVEYGHEVLLGPPMRGWVPNPSLMPGAILETVFLTRPAEADFVTSARGREVLGAAITAAIRAFLER